MKEKQFLPSAANATKLSRIRKNQTERKFAP
jgi:hypothetical protein